MEGNRGWVNGVGGRGQQRLYDRGYVGRRGPREQTGGGLFLGAPEAPPMHLARVISVGGGALGESGSVAANAGVAPGDLVYCAQRRRLFRVRSAGAASRRLQRRRGPLIGVFIRRVFLGARRGGAERCCYVQL